MPTKRLPLEVGEVGEVGKVRQPDQTTPDSGHTKCHEKGIHETLAGSEVREPHLLG